MASKIKVDQLETADGSGTIALQNQLSGMTNTSLPSGSILQIQKSGSHSETSTTSTSFVDTNMSVGITPTSSSSKIVVVYAGQCAVWGSNANQRMGFKVVRKISGGSNTDIVNSLGSSEMMQVRGTPAEVNGMMSGVWLDEPSTTSAITYMFQINRHSNADNAKLYASGYGSQMIAYEIKG